MKKVKQKQFFQLLVRGPAVISITLFIGLFVYLSFSKESASFHYADVESVQAQTTVCDEYQNNWSQVAHDAQHTGSTTDTFTLDYTKPFNQRIKINWRHAFQPDKVYPQVQAIVYCEKVFVGTEGANGKKPTLYAFDANTTNTNGGTILWTFEAQGPIMSSVAAAADKVFLSDMSGILTALNVSDGSVAWSKQLSTLGFSTSPIVADGKVMLGGRDGRFYAVNYDGTFPAGWDASGLNIGSPILQTAAYNNGVAYFGTMDIKVHGVSIANKNETWVNDIGVTTANGGKMITPDYGVALKDYWPVIHQGKVIVAPMVKNGAVWWDTSMGGVISGSPFKMMWSNADTFVEQHRTAMENNIFANVPNFYSAQDTMIANHLSDPVNKPKNIIALNEQDGAEPYILPQAMAQVMHGGITPGCVNTYGGQNNLIMPMVFLYSGWGILDLSYSGGPRYTSIFYDSANIDEWGQVLYDLGRTTDGEDNNNNGTIDDAAERFSGNRPAGMGNQDEDLNITCAGNLIFAFHVEELNANFTGVYDLSTRRWSKIEPGHSNAQMSSNTYGGGTNPASVSNGKIYHISWYELIVRSVN